EGLTECGPRQGQNREFGIDREGVCRDCGKPHGREPALVLLAIALGGSGILEQVDAAGMPRFAVFQPDLPYEPGLVGDVTGEIVYGFGQFLSPGTGERKTKQECGQHVRYTSAAGATDVQAPRSAIARYKGGPSRRRLLSPDRPLRVPWAAGSANGCVAH